MRPKLRNHTPHVMREALDAEVAKDTSDRDSKALVLEVVVSP